MFLSGVSCLAICAATAQATPITVTNAPTTTTNFQAPNTTGGVGAVTLGGRTYTNQGMVGAGRYTATGRDFNNDTLGSFSGMSFINSTWRRDPVTGQYSGGMYTLPDRGPNFALTGLPGTFFSNYNGRLNGWNFTFNPYTGVNLPQATTSQSQMALSPNGGFFFADFTGTPFTGLEPGSNTFTQNGFTFGGPASGLGAGRISLDAEAMALAPDGTFWVSDEYQTGIFRFSATGQMIGYIPAIPAILPRVGGVVNFTTADAVAGQTGRRLNQGLEGLTITPDGKTLWVMLQSAALQDSTLSNDALRNTTRLLGYDISGAVPTAPVAHYVMELPVFNRGNTNGTVTAGQASNRTAAQSEILALNGTQFLVLSRDGNGLGNDSTAAVGNDGRPPVFKSVMLIDTAGATNIAGTTRETTPGGVVTTAPGVLDVSIVPVQQVQLVNLINSTELTRFGLNLATGTGTNLTTLSEKWEAMGLLPTLEEDKPQDVFLFVGNDNDFLTTNGNINGGVTNGTTTINGYNSGFVNDNQFMVYRLTLPTYVDPLYLQAMIEATPVVVGGLAETIDVAGRGAGRAISAHVDTARQLGAMTDQGRFSAWMVGTYQDIDPVISGASYVSQTLDGTMGVETGIAPGTIAGAALTASNADVRLSGGFGHEAKALGGSAYLGFSGENLFAQASYGFTRLWFEDIRRPGAYGLSPVGNTEGQAHALAAKVGYLVKDELVHFGPVFGVSWASGLVDGYTEAGGAGGNVSFATYHFQRLETSAGLEATLQVDFRPTLHVHYTNDMSGDQDPAWASLAAAASAMATQGVAMPGRFSDVLTVGFGVQQDAGGILWHVGYDADFELDTDDEMTHRVTIGASLRF